MLTAGGPVDLGEGRPVAASAQHAVVEGDTVRIVNLVARTSVPLPLPVRMWPASSDVLDTAFSDDGRAVAVLIGTSTVSPWQQRAVIIAASNGDVIPLTLPAPDGTQQLGWLGERLVISSLGTTDLVDQQPHWDSATGFVNFFDPTSGTIEPVPGLPGGGQVVVP